ncbi:peptide ABC transporter substrate-binding protein [Candidatus Saccharibacteria bacterium]|nr:peptide ABC transporter substrate-binding protein [Candidatus Saccharibacteria bacterium]
MAKSSGSWNRFQYLRIRKRISSTARGVEAVASRHARKFILERWKSAKSVRRNIGIWLVGVGLLITAVIVQFLVVRNVYTDIAKIDGGTYAEGIYSKLETLNPILASAQAEYSASRLIFSSLFRYDDTGSLSADLAKGYKVSDDGKTYTVTLRSDASWHDGNPVTVDDIMFTVGLLKKPASGSTLSGSWRDIQAVRIDNQKIAFNLPSAYAPFPHALTFSILPKHILKDVPLNGLREHRFSKEPIGSGPFIYRYTQQVKGSGTHTVLHLKKNNSYYGGAVKLDRFQVHAYEDRDELAAALRTQAVNAASGLSLNSLKTFDDNGRFESRSTPIQAGVYALFNTSSVLKDKTLRKALQVGTDVDKLLSSLEWKPQRMDMPFTKNQINTDIKKPAYNLSVAKKMLDESGWKVGVEGVRYKNKKPLRLRLMYLKDTDYEVVVEGLARQWRNLGFQVEANSVDAKDPSQNFVSSVLQPRNFDVLVHELTVGADPDGYAYWHSSQASARGLNFTNFKDEVSDDALSSARARQESSLRQAKYESFLRRWYSEAPAIGLYQSSAAYVTSSKVGAASKHARFVTESDRYYNVIDWTARSGVVYKTP